MYYFVYYIKLNETNYEVLNDFTKISEDFRKLSEYYLKIVRIALIMFRNFPKIFKKDLKLMMFRL